MEKAKAIEAIFMGVIALLVAYKIFYTVLGFLVKPKVFKDAPKTKRYGIIIAAKDEERVIGLLLDTLFKQSYPAELFTVFVVADNCTDRTAEIARLHGAVVYERVCPEKARKGWALEFLFENIEKDYGITSFDGYLFFDADNLVAGDYLEQMNNAFATGVDGVIGYRNAKNFDRNLISAHYGIHFMRSTMTFHRPRSRLGLSTHIAGTGYLLSAELLKDGWHYYRLTEDTQATMDFVVKGKRIEYCEAAEFFDEQPYQVKVMVRQRIRWAKGRLACFFTYGHKLVKGIFKTKADGSVSNPDEAAKGKGFVERISWLFTFLCNRFARVTNKQRGKISCYDMFFYLLPNSFLTKLFNLAFSIVGIVTGIKLGEWADAGAKKWAYTVLVLVLGSVTGYISKVLTGLAVVVRERKHIRCSNLKLAWYLLSWPLYDITYAYICFASLFMRVKWKPIKHDEAIDITSINK